MPEPTPETIDTTLLIVKALGGLGGSIISVSVLPALSRRETIARTATGVIAAILFARPLVDLIGWREHGIQYLLAASGGLAFLAWFAFGLLARSASRWQTLDDALADFRKITKKGDK